jgi:hypothetical protein
MIVVSKVLLGGAMAWFGLTAAPGDEINPLVRERIAVSPVQMTMHGRDGSVRVQVGVNMFMPGPTDEGEAAEKVRERARRGIYEMAAHECNLLRDVLASECRLQAVTVNVTRQMTNASTGYNVSGQITLQVTLK